MQNKVIPNNIVFDSVEELIAEGKSVSLRVKGYSMRPFLRNERDIVLLSPLAGIRLRVGMVLLFRYRGKVVLHRLCRIVGGRLEIAGDGNYRQTEVAEAGDVIAYVSEMTVEGGRTLRYGTAGWRCRSAASLGVKMLRTIYHDLRKTLKI